MYSVVQILQLKLEKKIPFQHLIPDRFTKPIEKTLYLHNYLFTRYHLEFSFQGTDLCYFVGLISRRHLEFTHHDVVLTVFNYLLLSDTQMTDTSGQVTHLSSSRSLSIWMCSMYHCYFNSRGRGSVYLVYIGLMASSEKSGDRLDITMRNWSASKSSSAVPTASFLAEVQMLVSYLSHVIYYHCIHELILLHFAFDSYENFAESFPLCHFFY